MCHVPFGEPWGKSPAATKGQRGNPIRVGVLRCVITQNQPRYDIVIAKYHGHLAAGFRRNIDPAHGDCPG
jgi:hypothetical protein